MSSRPRPIRSGRSTRRRLARPVVAVTGAASGIGMALARHLVQAGAQGTGAARVIAIDDRRGDVPAATWRILDVRDPGLADRLTDVDVVVHLAVDSRIEGDAKVRTARNVRGVQTVLTAAPAAGVRRVVLCTSAMVYGAYADNPVPLDEDAPLRAVPESPTVSDLLELESLAERAPRVHTGLEVSVVRPAMLVGPAVDSVLTRHFEAPRLLFIRESRPHWQFCHVDDLVSGLAYAALGAVEGNVTVGCEGWLDQDDVEALSGMHRMELPPALAFGVAGRLHRLGLTPAPASDLQYVVHPWVVPSTRLRDAGWRPQYDNVQALAVLLQEVEGRHAVVARRLGRKDATVGAAGATAALVGTAALVRRARRKRRG
ncbi:MAG: NAD-dependent epimerase/dehydratase family protein [Streptomycetales bacterium]